MMDEGRIIERIDACRPGSDDIQHADLADLARTIKRDRHVAGLYRRVQSVDAIIGSAMVKVAVPSGLEQRVLERLAGQDPPSDLSVTEVMVPDRTRDWHRRRWLVAATAAAIGIGVTITWLWPRGKTLTLDSVFSQVEDWWQQLEKGSWKAMNSTPPQDYPVSPLVVTGAQRWKPLTAQDGRKIVAYDMTIPGVGRAILFVIDDAVVANLTNRPPAQPRWTLNRSFAAWQTHGLLYVLVVEGPQRHYRRYVNTQAPPLA